MSQPFTRPPEPEILRPFKRRLQPDGIQQALRDGWRRATRLGEDLWRRGRRHPRALGMIGGAAALILVGGYTVNATGIGRSACAAAAEAGSPKSQSGTTPRFLLLMDPVSGAVAGSELEIHYDVCGLPSGTAYRGRVELAQQKRVKRGSAKPKPLVVTFKDRVYGVEARRHRDVMLGKLQPGAYTQQLTVVDNRGRERKQLQKIQVKAR
jgi:hypothetical protein